MMIDIEHWVEDGDAAAVAAPPRGGEGGVL